jgi:hypothetical protein
MHPESTARWGRCDALFCRGRGSTAASLSALYHEVTLTAELAEKRKAVELKYSHLKALRLRADEVGSAAHLHVVLRPAFHPSPARTPG